MKGLAAQADDLRAVAGHLIHLFRHVMNEDSTLCVWGSWPAGTYDMQLPALRSTSSSSPALLCHDDTVIISSQASCAPVQHLDSCEANACGALSSGSCVLAAIMVVKGEKGPGTSFTDITITYNIDVKHHISCFKGYAISCKIVFTHIMSSNMFAS